VTRPLKTEKKTVVLQQPAATRPSRIRRDPVPVVHPGEDKKLGWNSSEREIWMALIGIVAFAIAIDIIALAIGVYWS
jgi:hypothetical protein